MLSNEQNYAFELFKQRKNIFITGPGGTGKTFLIKKMYDWSNENNKNIQVCALTGCAAILLNCNAKTIHSWSGIGTGKGDIDTIINGIINNKYKINKWLHVNILIIDEVSMMSYKLLTILDKIAKIVKNNDIPFGGIQIVFSGDFYQLPPVGTKNEPQTSSFCFENPLWNQLFNHTIQLKQIFRQAEQNYCDVLNQIRNGVLNKKGYNLLLSRCISCEDEEIKPTKILPRKYLVDEINKNEMQKLNSEEFTYSIEIYKDPLNYNNYNTEQIKKNIESFKNSLMAEKNLKLKIGAQVMCIINLDTEGPQPIVNGSTGVVVGFNQNKIPIVKFKNEKQILMNYHNWEIEGLKGYSIKQIPLILAWGITIHKSQGITLENAEIDIGNGIFECGQSYVALSRVKSLEGLYLSAFNPNKIKINKKVKQFYSNLS